MSIKQFRPSVGTVFRWSQGRRNHPDEPEKRSHAGASKAPAAGTIGPFDNRLVAAGKRQYEDRLQAKHVRDPGKVPRSNTIRRSAA